MTIDISQNQQEQQIQTKDVADLWLQKQQELGWTDDQTKEIRSCFADIQKDIQDKNIDFNDYITSLDKKFLNDFDKQNTENRYTFFKENVLMFFELQGVTLTFKTFDKENKLLLHEKEVTTNEINTTQEQINTTDTNKEIRENFRTTKIAYEKLNPNIRTEIDNKIKNESQKPGYQEKRNNIKKILVEKGIADEYYADDYLKYSLTKNLFPQELTQDNPGTEFLSNFEKLKGSLGIIDDMGDIAETKNITKTTEELINQSPSLKEESEKPNPAIDNIAPTERELVQYMSDGDIDILMQQKKHLEQRYTSGLFQKDDLFLNPTFQVSQKDKEIIDYTNLLNQKLSESKSKLELAKKLIKQQITVSPILGISRYMDSEIGINQATRNFVDNDFILDPNGDIKLNNDLLAISGRINNKPITLSQNLKDEGLGIDNLLKISGYLNIGANNTIALGDAVTENVGVILPNKKNLSEKASRWSEQHLQKLLKEGSNLKEEIGQNLGSELLQDYGYENIVRNRLDTMLSTNLAKQESIQFIEHTLGIHISQEDLQKERLGNEESGNFDIIKNFINGLHSLNLDQTTIFRDNLGKLGSIIQSTSTNTTLNGDMILKNFSSEKNKINKEVREKTPKEKTNVFKLFDCLTYKIGEKTQININDFSKLIATWSKQETVQNNQNNFSPFFREKYINNFTLDTAQSAEKDLQLDNNALWL